MVKSMDRIYIYSLRSNGSIKHIVSNIPWKTLCGREFVWSVWENEAYDVDLSEMKVCRQCQRKANRMEREVENAS
jgi:hypothetical protein